MSDLVAGGRQGVPPPVTPAEIGSQGWYQPLWNMEHPLTEADGMQPAIVTRLYPGESLEHVDVQLMDGTDVIHIQWGWPVLDHTEAGYGYAVPANEYD